MKGKRWLTLCLTAMLAASAMTACGKTESKTGKTADTAGSTETNTEPAVIEPEKYVADYLPEKKYDGYEYRIVDYEEYPLHREEATGSVIDDAIYERNLLAAEKFDIQFMRTTYPYSKFTEVGAMLKQSGRAQSDDYDLYFVVFPDAYTALSEGAMPPASALPYTDPSKPWYYRAVNEGLCIDGVQLMAYTAFDKNPGGKCLIFNQKIFDDLGEAYPYRTVEDGAWTYDRFYTLTETAVADLDGDGSVNESDRFGFITSTDDYTDFTYYGSGQKLMDFSGGTPVINQSEQLFDMYLKASEYLKKARVVLDVYKMYGMTTESHAKGLDLFTSGHAMFTQTNVSNLVRLGDMEDDYGLVPYPKWTEAQAQYYCGMDGSRIAVPSTGSTDLERVSVVKEYLSVESLNINYPAYYEVSLKNRYVRDTDSIRMMEIITESVMYDMGCALNYEAVRGPWMSCLQKSDTNFASAVEKNLAKAEKVIDKLNENIASIKESYQ